VQDPFRAQSTLRTAFRQEEEDDEDMTPMHMTMIGVWHEKGVQQGYPSKEGGSRLIQFESPRWSPVTSRVFRNDYLGAKIVNFKNFFVFVLS
jgi:hypothetical protein